MVELTAANNRVSIKPLQLICIMAILQVVIAFFTDPMILSFDEAMWQYIGRNWIRNGLIPYHGGIDNKSPLIFLVFGISDRLFGVNFWFPRLIGILVQSAGIYGLYKIAEKMISPFAGILAISFYGLSLLWHSTGGKYVSYTETYAITAVIISVYYCIVRQENKLAFVGGLFAGLGFGFRFSAAFGILPVFLYTWKKNSKAAFLFLLGIGTSILLLVLAGELAGIKISEFLLYGLTDNIGTGSATDHPLAWKIQMFANGFFYSELLLFYPAVIFYFLLNKKMDFLKTWLIFEFLGIVIIGIYDRVHFKNLLPALSLMSAFVINYLVEKDYAPVKQIMLGLWILFFPKTFEPLFAAKKLFTTKNNQSAANSGQPTAFEEEGLKRKIGLWIRSNTLSSEKVFVAGYGAQILSYSERISPTVYFNVTQTAVAKKRLFSDLSDHKPAMVLIPLSERYAGSVDPDIRNFMNEMVAGNYTLDTSIFNYNIFRFNQINKP
jgi:hypothetical protein